MVPCCYVKPGAAEADCLAPAEYVGFTVGCKHTGQPVGVCSTHTINIRSDRPEDPNTCHACKVKITLTRLMDVDRWLALGCPGWGDASHREDPVDTQTTPVIG